MKFKDCLTADVVVSALLARTCPEDSWIVARNSKVIPEPLFKFYVEADYFSFDKCPKFLADDQRIMFSHLGASVDLIKSSFEDYHELFDLMKKYDADTYNPIKKLKNEPFDPSAPKHFNRCLQLLLINMYSILDSTAEVISAVLSWGNFGRASFAEIVKKVKDGLKTSAASGKKTIVSADEKYQDDINNLIKMEILDDSNNEWFELFKLYRDKMAHFRYHSGFLFHDNDEKFYHFLSRQWPYYFQQGITYGKSKEDNLKSYFDDLLMECDIFEYCEGLHKKIYDLTENIFQPLAEAYNIKKASACGSDSDLQAKVKLLTRKYKFKQF
ncbi:MAG: hypothetical protein A2Y00_09720 [Omnitrophica WOR_2 bacterium GWF2_43_52]|nr:MAG: hypothetical protein A2Y01_00590 [Omnitrophica WOR_2 bacterium GWC2_44_8]OGX21510.1 MAG: hypothetical protein A2Y00_09720 [Omnitrophica WOR_2 bacterium GWF2_43_52]OGX53580.1 MAG: hypothetical protein A2460_00520 [Omnitrophica WOR_2 bacterium RIFOXYC2_FULL_43_9]HAH19394.1 hypothetical protein [Candidatus Omnitrophota bacterium]HBG63765.1 hypothetical protein [Candidatus Omnitrophota bacterium]